MGAKPGIPEALLHIKKSDGGALTTDSGNGFSGLHCREGNLASKAGVGITDAPYNYYLVKCRLVERVASQLLIEFHKYDAAHPPKPNNIRMCRRWHFQHKASA